MAMVPTSRGRREITNQLKEKELSPSPDRVKIRAEQRRRASEKKKAAVVYYLSRNGHLEHPHFMEVPLSSSHGSLYLKDVINRLNALRGEGLAALYSWSAKRSYKNGYVWHDLTKEDFIHPVHGNEYVLKGTELLAHNSGSSCTESSVAATLSSTSSGTEKLLQDPKSCSQEIQISNFSGPLRVSNKKNNWGSLDLNEYYAFKSELLSYENNVNINNNVNIIDASTQTDERREIIRRETENPTVDVGSTELSRDEISPPPSSSSPDQAVETVIKSRGLNLGEEVGNLKGKASGVLMQLISCGISVKEQSGIGSGRRLIGGSNRFGGDKVEKKIDGFQRCSSYNTERGVKLEFQKEMVGGHSRCMPRNSKMKKEGGNSYLPPVISRSSNGSKRFNN
ncbi:hypothetical protein LUZ60_010933 [Juncus effusus]|nr:hypothetical protein LUZ60_010933 [Juncus effusus]